MAGSVKSATIARERDVGPTREAVLAGLSAHNAAVAGPRNGEPLVLSLRDGDGTIVGGLVGELKWEWLHVDLVWIDEAHRGGGDGRALLAAAEDAARAHGARGVYLSTMSLQAPGFYPKLGYQECGRMEDYPVRGFSIQHFTKRL